MMQAQMFDGMSKSDPIEDRAPAAVLLLDRLFLESQESEEEGESPVSKISQEVKASEGELLPIIEEQKGESK